MYNIFVATLYIIYVYIYTYTYAYIYIFLNIYTYIHIYPICMYAGLWARGYNFFVHTRKNHRVENQTRTRAYGYKLTPKPATYRVFTRGHAGKMFSLPSLQGIRSLLTRSSDSKDQTWVLSFPPLNPTDKILCKALTNSKSIASFYNNESSQLKT